MSATGAGARLCLPLLALLACQQSPGLGNSGFTRASHKFQIVSGPHAVDCNTCHGDFQSFGQFTCFNCHGHEKLLTDMLHVSLVTRGTASLPDGGVGYAYDNVSCLQCHSTGAGVPYDHAGITVSCATCHDTGAPFDPLPVAGVGLDGGTFMHPPKGNNDCRACHTMTSWLGAGKAPGGLPSDPLQDVTVDTLVPSWAGTSISGLTAETATLHMGMNHQTTDIAAATLSACGSCHENAGSGEYYPGLLHSSLANSVPVIAQPTLCMDCHSGSIPLGFVGPTATNPARTPASGEMKHDAVVWNGAGPTTTTASRMTAASVTRARRRPWRQPGPPTSRARLPLCSIRP